MCLELRIILHPHPTAHVIHCSCMSLLSRLPRIRLRIVVSKIQPNMPTLSLVAEAPHGRRTRHWRRRDSMLNNWMLSPHMSNWHHHVERRSSAEYCARFDRGRHIEQDLLINQRHQVAPPFMRLHRCGVNHLWCSFIPFRDPLTEPGRLSGRMLTSHPVGSLSPLLPPPHSYSQISLSTRSLWHQLPWYHLPSPPLPPRVQV